MPKFKFLNSVLQYWCKHVYGYETDGVATEVAAILWNMGHLALGTDTENSSCGPQAALSPLQLSPRKVLSKVITH